MTEFQTGVGDRSTRYWNLERVLELEDRLARRTTEFDAQMTCSVGLMESLTRMQHAANDQIAALSRANTAAVNTIQDYVREEQNAEDRRAARLAARRGRGFLEPVKLLLFLLVAMSAWWLVNVVANLVIVCIPGGAPCNLAGGPLVPAAALTQMTIPQWVMLSVSLAIAVFAATICVYGNNDAD